jgi:Histidine phosphatase superfamily (branch 1)
VLIRHGRSSHMQRGWISDSGFRVWREEYEAAGIADDERAPEHLQKVARGADLVLSSDAQRAVATARLLAPERPIVISPLLRELELEGPELGGLRLPRGLGRSSRGASVASEAPWEVPVCAGGGSGRRGGGLVGRACLATPHDHRRHARIVSEPAFKWPHPSRLACGVQASVAEALERVVLHTTFCRYSAVRRRLATARRRVSRLAFARARAALGFIPRGGARSDR